MKNLRIANELMRIAEDLIYADSGDYIYDPDHKKHPGGGYHKTEKGWSKLEEKEDKGKTTDKSTSNVEMTDKQKGLDYILENSDYMDRRDVASNVAKNPNTHHSTLDKLSNYVYDDVRRNVAENPNTHPSTLDKLSNDEDYDVRRNVAKNIHTSSETLDKLSNDKHWVVRSNVAWNRNTSPETLDKLSKDENESVRWNVSWNRNTSPETLDKLSNDEDWEVRTGVAHNSNTSDETLKKMSKVKYDSETGPSFVAGFRLQERKEKRKQERAKKKWQERAKKKIERAKKKQQNGGFDITKLFTKLSHKMREKVKDWDIEDIKKFIGWLKEHKG